MTATAATAGRATRRVRTPTVLQLEAVECGAAALAMVLAAHGRWVPLDELRVACGVSRDGSKASNVVKAARRYGLDAKGYRRDLDGLAELPMPAIAFVNLGHFVVVEGISRGKVYLNDPAAGRQILTTAEFDAMYSGVVLAFAPGPDFTAGGQRPPLTERLVTWLDGGRMGFSFVVLAGICLVLPGIFVPAFTRIFVDQYLVEGQKDWVAWLLAALVATALVQGALLWLKQTILQRLESRIAIRAAARFVWRMLRMPVTFFGQRYAGAVGVRADYAPALGDLAAGQLGTVLIDVVAVVFFIVVMLGYSPVLTMVAVGCGTANLMLFLLLRGRVEALEQKTAIDQVKLSGKTMQGLQMIESLKANGTDGPFFTAWSGQHALVESQQQAVGRAGAMLTLSPEFLGQVAAALVLMTGGLLVMQGAITVGMLVAFQGLQTAFNAPIQSIVQAGLKLQSARGTIDQLEDVLDHPLARELSESAPDKRPASAVSTLGSVRRLDGHVAIRGLTFGYSPLEPPLISGFDLDIAPGTRVALVGASGSGKSTIGKLLSGLYDPWAGAILLDGRPLAEYPRDLLRNSAAVVDQDIVLFDGTVQDNITLWDDTMPERSVVRAAKDAAIHEVVVARPGGYESRVEEGGRNFSGGQRQRLEIARALVTDPTLLILDEATSALDPLVEQTIMENLRRRGCACLIIAHRLSTIRDCDEIVVMHKGEILQRGTHDSLIAVDGPYRRLVEA